MSSSLLLVSSVPSFSDGDAPSDSSLFLLESFLGRLSLPLLPSLPLLLSCLALLPFLHLGSIDLGLATVDGLAEVG